MKGEQLGRHCERSAAIQPFHANQIPGLLHSARNDENQFFQPTTPQVAVFTTALVANGQVQWLDEHLCRLRKHAAAFDLYCPADDVLKERIQLHVETASTHLIKVIIGDCFQRIETRQIIPPTPKQYAEGARIIVTDICVQKKFAQLKTTLRAPYEAASYFLKPLERQSFATIPALSCQRRLASRAQRSGMAKGCAQQRRVALYSGLRRNDNFGSTGTLNAFEALLVDANGFVVDATRSSPMLFKNDTLISLEGGIKGITREKVLDKARELGLSVRRDQMKPSELVNGLLLVAGSGIGLVASGKVQNQMLLQLINEFRTFSLCENEHK